MRQPPRPVVLVIDTLELNSRLQSPRSASLSPTSNLALKPVRVTVAEDIHLAIPEDDPAPTVSQPIKLGAMRAHCEVHIHQSAQGTVQAIDFGTCTGDARWQSSLIETLQHAVKLIQPSQGAHFPPVRTLTVATDSLSAAVLAQQLSTADSLDGQLARTNP